MREGCDRHEKESVTRPGNDAEGEDETRRETEVRDEKRVETRTRRERSESETGTRLRRLERNVNETRIKRECKEQRARAGR